MKDMNKKRILKQRTTPTHWYILFVSFVLFAVIFPHSLYAQERAWYVSGFGDDADDGRSEDTAFRTMYHAVVQASKSSVKKIYVVGEIDRWLDDWERLPQDFEGGEKEILITGLDEDSALINNSDFHLYNGNFRFENLFIQTEISIGDSTGEDETRAVFGEGVIFSGGKTTSIGINIYGTVNSTTVIMEKDAQMIDCPWAATMVEIDGGLFIMKDDALISDIGLETKNPNIAVRSQKSISSFIMQDNAKITNCGAGGVSFSGTFGDITIKNNAEISNCGGTALAIDIGDLGTAVIQDNVKIINNGNSKLEEGGGIRFSRGMLTIKGNVEISGNRAVHGGGIWYGGESFVDYGEYNTPFYRGPDEYLRLRLRLQDPTVYGHKVVNGGGETSGIFIEGNVKITGNIAKEGGGIYADIGVISNELTYAGPLPFDFMGWFPERVKIRNVPRTLTMKSGTVSGNKADFGAGLYAKEQGDAQDYKLDPMTNAIIPIKTRTTSPAFTFSGGTITGNTAKFSGGGVYVKKGGAYKAGAGKVSGNTAGDGDGNDVFICLDRAKARKLADSIAKGGVA